MALIDQVRDDIVTILSGDFAVDIQLLSGLDESVSQTASLKGIHTRHHLGVHPEKGTPINSKRAEVSFAEKTLLQANPDYPLRNDQDEVHMKNHYVKVKDSTGTLRTYTIDQWLPDETVGLITLILGEYDAG